jgi:MFS family permease
MTARPARSTHGVLDLAILAGALLNVATQLAFGHGVELHAAAPDFPDRFRRVVSSAGAIAIPLGACTAVLIFVTLLREGMAGRRARLRVAALVAILGTGLIGTATLEPLTQAIAAAPSEARPIFLERYRRWQLVIEAGTAAAAVALLLAHRAPRPVGAVSPGGMTSRHRRLLLLLGTATLFEGYDRFIASLALPYIARDLGADEGELGWALSAIRVGALLAVGIGFAADRFGRRRLLLVTVLAYTLATAATGFSRGLLDFVCLQLVAIAFLSAELSLAQVVIAEEFPARARGLGQGLLGASGAIGAGLAAMLFPVLAGTAFGWRGLYLIGVLPLLLVSYLRRSLPETTRWQALGERSRRRSGILDVLTAAHRGRFGVLVVVTIAATAAAAAAFNFASYRATTSFGWTPGQVSGMVLVGGGIGFWGWMVFGRLADVVGRRITGVLSLSGGGVAIGVFYGTEYLLPGFTALVFFEAGVSIAINALATEIFPTALRATAKSWITNAGVLGAILGLGAVGGLAERAGGHAGVVTTLGALPVVLSPLLFLLPETHGQELEKTSGEAA